MAITATALATSTNNGSSANYTGLALSQAAAPNTLITAWIASRHGSAAAAPTSVTVSGVALTLVASVNFNTVTTPLFNLSCWRGMSASPSGTTASVTFATARTGIGYSIIQFDGVQTGGTNGSSAITANIDAHNANGVTTLNGGLTLNAFGSVNNATAAGFALDTNNQVTPEGTWTELGEAVSNNPRIRIQSQWLAANDTTPSASWTTSDAAGIALEIVELVVAAATFDQDGFRFRNDDGSESTATWLAALNTNATLVTDTTYRLRFLVQNTGAGASTDTALEWQYNLDGAGWNAITTSSPVVRATATANLTDGADCTQQLGAGTFFANNDGVTEDGIAGGAVLDLPNAQETETELSFQIRSAEVTSGQTVQFRLVRDSGTVLDTYTNTPTATAYVPTRAQVSWIEFEVPEAAEVPEPVRLAVMVQVAVQRAAYF